ncbi:MAG: hypothetical protein QM601_06095 [Pseudoxanthomonas sp.]
MRMFIALFFLASTFAVHAGVGLRALKVAEPITGKTVPVEVFYPSSNAADDAAFEAGPYRIAAERGAAPDAGRHPLVLISHGHGGSRWGHHDLAEFLASHGYVVAAVEHPGDSFADQSGVGTDVALRGRAYQASAAISALLADPMFASVIDPARIGVAGFSAGGYTSLLLLGARPDFGRLIGYCRRHPRDAEICAGGAVPAEKIIAGISVLKNPPPMADARIRAGFAMAPLGIFFGPGSLDAVKAPVFLYEAANDATLLPDENARNVRKRLGTTYAFRSVRKADHYVFLAPCGSALAEAEPQLCRDPQGVDRVAVHAQLQRDALAFFDDALKPAGAEGAKP